MKKNKYRYILYFFMLWIGINIIAQLTSNKTTSLFVPLGLLGLVGYGIFYFINKNRKKKPSRESYLKTNPNTVILKTTEDNLILNNPFRGFFVVGAAGSGKSESIAVPLLEQFIEKNYSGIIYDFKFPTLANEVETFMDSKGISLGSAGRNLKHYYVCFDDNIQTHKINPIAPKYVPNTTYAREYAQSIIANLMKESIKKPDYWTRSATDILTACIWFLREEHPEHCDIPHLFALITSNDTQLLKLLQTNILTQQMTISIFSAMERGADSQVSGVIGTLQGAIAQINTPDLMHVFSADETPLNVNDPKNPIILTIGNNPTISSTLAPLCSLIITVCTKLMNQPDKHASFVMLDEAPTIFIPNLEIIPNTGRSNKISTVIMCQDIAQLTDGYGKEKADVLFSACNNHFYGRVSSSQTAEILSKQFGKQDKTYLTKGNSSSSGGFLSGHSSQGNSTSQSIQEREIIKASEFINFDVGYFASIMVESSQKMFKGQFLPVTRKSNKKIKRESFNNNTISKMEYYKEVRENINTILNHKPLSEYSKYEE